MTYAEVLTPTGTAALAVIRLSGAGAWASVQKLFRPVGRSLPPEIHPRLHRYGHVGDGVGDEVMLFVPHVESGEPSIEIHCHGGRHAVRWLMETLSREGISEVQSSPAKTSLETLLSRATTLRWASILLDQFQGAYTAKLHEIIARIHQGKGDLAAAALQRLLSFAPITTHLETPFTVACVGPPNVGKSSLMNKLAGYTRSIVSETAGTTRDLVTQELALDGIPLRFIDTAGLRESSDALEQAGIRRSRTVIQDADLVLHLHEANMPCPDEASKTIIVATKVDIHGRRDRGRLAISSVTGEGIAELTTAMRQSLVPSLPEPGEAVPTDTADLPIIQTALSLLPQDPREAAETLTTILSRMDRLG